MQIFYTTLQKRFKMKNTSYMAANLPVIEIVATTRAKKRAATKIGIPFSYGDKINTEDLFDTEEKHVHVDLTAVRGYDKYKYHKLMKKYYRDELQKILAPHHKTLCAVVWIAASILAVGSVYTAYKHQSNKLNNAPQQIQKASTIQNVNNQKQNEG